MQGTISPLTNIETVQEFKLGTIELKDHISMYVRYLKESNLFLLCVSEVINMLSCSQVYDLALL